MLFNFALFMSAIEGFKTEVILYEIPPELKIFLSTELSFLVYRSRPTILDDMLITKELRWQLIYPFPKDADLNVVSRG